jgi:hypothetical protein
MPQREVNKMPFLIRCSFFAWKYLLFTSLALAGFLLGCGGVGAIGTSLRTPAIAPSSNAAISGKVYGGNLPASGATVQLYAAGSGGYGSAGRPLLNCSGAPDGSGIATAPCAGVIADGAGNFSIVGKYSCPANAYVYLVATGGDSGAGRTNSALALMAGLGACSYLRSSDFVTINEITTAASVTALQQFMGVTYGTAFAESVGTTSTNSIGLANAFAAIPQLVNLSTGAALASGSGVNTINGTVVTLNWISQQSKINTLGNILSYCVNTGDTVGPPSTISTQCSSLFSAVKPAAQSNAAADTIQAMLDMAANPVNVGSVSTGPFQYAANAPSFSPALSSAPNDWTLGLTYYSNQATTYPQGTGTSAAFLSNGFSLAIDSNGVVWVVGNLTVSGISPGGTPYGQVLNGSVNNGRNIAIDTNNNLYVANSAATWANGEAAITEYVTATGAINNYYLASANSGSSWIYGLAIDSTNNIFAESMTGAFELFEVPAGSASGTLMTPVMPIGSTSERLAVDSKHNVWVSALSAGYGGANGVTEAVATCSGTPAVCTYPSVGKSYTGGTSSGEMFLATGIGIDSSGYVWVADGNAASTYPNGSGVYQGNHITRLTPGAYTTGTGSSNNSATLGAGGANDPFGLAIDGADHIWVANAGQAAGDSVSEFTNASTPVALSGSTGFWVNVNSAGVPNTASEPRDIAIDNAGNVWVSGLLGQQSASPLGYGLTELVGSAVPVVTPLPLTLSGGTTGPSEPVPTLSLTINGLQDQQTISESPFVTDNTSPAFTVQASSTYSSSVVTTQIGPTPNAVYYQVDSTSGAWSTATVSTNSGTSLAVFEVPPTTVSAGNHTLYAYGTYGRGSTPIVGSIASMPFTVSTAPASKLASTLTMSSSPNTHGNYAATGSTVTYTATVSGNGPSPSGTMEFLDGSTVLASAQPLSSGTATYTDTSIAAGFHSVTAVYSGDSNYLSGTYNLVEEATSSGTSYMTAPVVSVSSTAVPSIVYDYSTAHCDLQDIPDDGARAFYDADGDVHLIASHSRNRQMIGTTLDNVVQQCPVIYENDSSGDPSLFDDQGWLESYYTLDGNTIYALISLDYHPYRHSLPCDGSTTNENCWYSTITAATSPDKGYHFISPAPGVSRFVAGAPVKFDISYPNPPGSNDNTAPEGAFVPTNILQLNGLYYMLVQQNPNTLVTGGAVQSLGDCVMQTNNLADPTAWRAWDGTGFNIQFQDPYTTPGIASTKIATTGCTTVNNYAGRSLLQMSYMNSIIGYIVSSQNGANFATATSADLIHWTAAAVVNNPNLSFNGTCISSNTNTYYGYPAMLDASISNNNTTDRNYDTVYLNDSTTYLYATQFVNCSVNNLNRNLVRVPMTITYP